MNPAYIDWRDRPKSFLWLQGFAGCGKTILCSTVINDMTRYKASRTQYALAFYYFDFTNDIKTKTLNCLRSLLLQLAEQTADTKSLQALHRAYAMGTPPIQEFLDVLKSIICKHDRVYIVVDALDECTDQEELFDLLNSIRDWKLECLSILTTSRDEPNIRECMHPAPEQEIRLRNSAIDDDLRLFITETLQKDKKLQVWSDIFPEIEEALTNGAHGMFRWVDCQLQSLRECPSRAEVRKALKNLPETLDKTYERMLRNIRPNLRDYALRLLQWLCIADQPVRLDHVIDAFATSIGDEPHFDPDARFVSSDKVFALCPGLIIKDVFLSIDCVQIAHYSVKEYLVSNRLPIEPDPLCMFRVQQPLANLAMAKTCLVYAIFASYEVFGLSSGFGPRLEAPFLRSAKDEWPKFFSNAKNDSQLMGLAISYLTQENGYTLDGDINAAMDLAIKHHFRDIETWLVDHHRPSIDPNFALLANCKVDDIHSLDFVEFWIEQGADVNTPYVNAPFANIPSIHKKYPGFNPRGFTPLHMAASWSRVALAQLLLQNGASLKAKDYEGSTPLEVAFANSSCLTPDLIELLWFDGGQNCFDSRGNNFLHKIARARRQQRDPMDGLRNNEVLMEETVAWLINHGVDPLSKNAKGETPLHKAAITNNPTTIKALYAATGSSSKYGGCLLAFLHRVRFGERMLSTAQLLLEIDPDPLCEFKHGSRLLPFLLSEAAENAKPVDGDNSAFGSEFTALIFKREEDPASNKLNIYMSLLEFILKDCSTDVSTIMHWLVTELVERRDPEFLGVEIWSAALIVLSHCLVVEIGYRNSERATSDIFRQIEELFERRKILGVGIKDFYRLLLWTALDGGPLAKLIISQEPLYAALGLSEETTRLPILYETDWRKMSVISLMVHREIHPDTKNEDDDAALLIAITHKRRKMYSLQTTRLLMERLLLKRACGINQQTQEGLTLLAGAVSYVSCGVYEWASSIEIVRICLDSGCDVDIQDNAGRTPLMTAAYRGVGEFVELLLNAGCNANLQDRKGGTSLTDIVTNDGISDEKTQKIWKQRFTPVGGYTALMYAVIVGRVLIVEQLLKHGCDTKLINNQGRTALDLARQFDESRIVAILESHEEPEQSGYAE